MTSLIHLIPAPAEMVPGEGFFHLNGRTRVQFVGAATSMAQDAAAFFSETIGPSTGMHLKSDKQKTLSGAIVFSLDTSLPREGYTLKVTPDLIEIASNDPAGFL